VSRARTYQSVVKYLGPSVACVYSLFTIRYSPAEVKGGSLRDRSRRYRRRRGHRPGGGGAFALRGAAIDHPDCIGTADSAARRGRSGDGRRRRGYGSPVASFRADSSPVVAVGEPTTTNLSPSLAQRAIAELKLKVAQALSRYDGRGSAWRKRREAVTPLRRRVAGRAVDAGRVCSVAPRRSGRRASRRTPSDEAAHALRASEARLGQSFLVAGPADVAEAADQREGRRLLGVVVAARSVS
jgi:hypothetical protein